MSHLKPVIRPTSKLHLAVLVVEGEPGDVDLAGGHEDAGRDVCAQALVSYHNICRVGSVKGLTRAGKNLHFLVDLFSQLNFKDAIAVLGMF